MRRAGGGAWRGYRKIRAAILITAETFGNQDCLLAPECTQVPSMFFFAGEPHFFFYPLTKNNNKTVTRRFFVFCFFFFLPSKVEHIDHGGRRVSKAASSATRSEGHFLAGPSYLFIWRNRNIIWPHGSREDGWRRRPRRFMTFIWDAPGLFAYRLRPAAENPSAILCCHCAAGGCLHRIPSVD